MELADVDPVSFAATASARGVTVIQLLTSINNAVASLLKIDPDNMTNEEWQRLRHMAIKPNTMEMILAKASQSPCKAEGSPAPGPTRKQTKPSTDDGFIDDDGVAGEEEDEEFSEGESDSEGDDQGPDLNIWRESDPVSHLLHPR